MRKILAVGLVAGVVAAPAALGVAPSAHTPPTKPVPVVSYLFKGTVLSHEGPTVVVQPVKGTNVFARRALKNVTPPSISVTIGTGTKVYSRIVNPDGTKKFLRENPAEIKAGDVVFFHIRAKKGLQAAELTSAARWIRDFTPNPPAPAPAS